MGWLPQFLVLNFCYSLHNAWQRFIDFFFINYPFQGYLTMLKKTDFGFCPLFGSHSSVIVSWKINLYLWLFFVILLTNSQQTDEWHWKYKHLWWNVKKRNNKKVVVEKELECSKNSAAVVRFLSVECCGKYELNKVFQKHSIYPIPSNLLYESCILW